MAIPDVGAALAAPPPQTPVSSGNKGRSTAQAGRQSFASIVSDLSDESTPAAGDAGGGAARTAARTTSDGPAAHGGQNGHIASPKGTGASKPTKASTEDDDATDLTASAETSANTSSVDVDADATAAGGRRNNGRSTADRSAEADDAVEQTGEVTALNASAPTLPVAKPIPNDTPQFTAADSAVTGQAAGVAPEGAALDAEQLIARAFARTRGNRADTESTRQGASQTVGGPGATQYARTSGEVAAAPDLELGDAASVGAEQTAANDTAVRSTTTQPADAVAEQLHVRRTPSADATLLARTSIRDALTRAVAADTSAATAPTASVSESTERSAAANDVVASSGAEAPALTGSTAAGKSGAVVETVVERSGHRSRSAAAQPAQPASVNQAQAPDGDGVAQPDADAVGPSDAVVQGERAASLENPRGSTHIQRPAVAARPNDTRAPHSARLTDDLQTAGATGAKSADNGEFDVRDSLAVGDTATPNRAITAATSPSTVDRMLASLAAQRAQRGYARAAAPAQGAATDPALPGLTAARVADIESARPADAVVDAAVQVPIPAGVVTPRGPVSRPGDARHGRPVSGASNQTPAATVLSPTLVPGAPVSSGITAAGESQAFDQQSSQEPGTDRSARATHQDRSSTEIASEQQAFFSSPMRQAADAGAFVSARTSARGGHDSNTTSPLPVAPRLTGTSAIAIAAFQAAAAAASTTPDVMTASAQAPSSRVLDSELPSQIVQAIRLRADNGNGQVHMRLNPDYLGDVSVDVRMNGSSVVASVHASSAEVRDWLRANEMQLRQTLADQGLHLQELVVADEEPSERESSGQRHQQPDEQPQERRARRPRETATFEVLL